jgi:transposase
VRAGRRTDMNCEFDVVIWPPLRLARMRCERGSVIVVSPACSPVMG